MEGGWRKKRKIEGRINKRKKKKRKNGGDKFQI